METITSLEYSKEDSESTRQEKNGILVGREVLYNFSMAMQELQEKGLISFEDIENLDYSYDEAKKNGMINKDVTEEEYEPENKEVFEYWLVSEWFYEKLKQLNEPIIEWNNLYIWGRTTTGQAIILDSVIDKIRELMN